MMTDASVVLERMCHAQSTQVVHGTISNNMDFKRTTPAHIYLRSRCSAAPSLLVFTCKAHCGSAEDLLPPAEHVNLRALDPDCSNPQVSHLQAMPCEQKLEQLPPAEQIQSVACIVTAQTYLQIRFEQCQIAPGVTSGGDAVQCLAQAG